MTPPTIDNSAWKARVARFDAEDDEQTINDVPNTQAEAWLEANVPKFECSDETITDVYWYRWWTFRKHIKTTPAGRIVTEFILPVRHAASHNAISCALGLHIAEGRWLADRSLIDEYVRFWFTANAGKPEPKFHFYSSWLAAALYERAFVTRDFDSLVGMLDLLVADYEAWEAERRLPNGLFWQYDVRDGMEESITGSRTHKNARPTINAYMAANARAISKLARRAGRDDIDRRFDADAHRIAALMDEHLWDESSEFYKAQRDESGLSDARELIGYVPFMFPGVTPPTALRAWRHLTDPAAFWAPRGFTTAERRHPQFRSHGVGKCEWDGAVWPFATSQTLVGLGHALRSGRDVPQTRATWFDALRIYADAHAKNGRRYIGEYHDEITGEWLKGDNPRSSYYNHSTFADLVITGLVGLVPRADGRVQVDPLFLPSQLKYFTIRGLRIGSSLLDIAYDITGVRHVAGLHVWRDEQLIGSRPDLGALTCDG